MRRIGILDALKKALTCDSFQTLGILGNLAAEKRAGRVSVVALVAGTDIHLDDIAFGEQPFAGNSVNHFIVDADAGTGRKTVVMQERRYSAVRRDKAVNLGIDMNQRNARLYQSRRKC